MEHTRVVGKVQRSAKRPKGIGPFKLIILCVLFAFAAWFVGKYVQKCFNVVAIGMLTPDDLSAPPVHPPKQEAPLNFNAR